MKRAFTLVELLVVIAVIVVLIAILLPAMNRAIETSVRAVCGARQHAVTQVLNTYAADSTRKYPPGHMECGGESVFQINNRFVEIVMSYSGNNKTARVVVNDPATGDYHWGLVPQILVDPSYKDFGYRNTCGYLMGYQLLCGKPILTRFHRPPVAPAGTDLWDSPMGLSKPGSGTLVTCVNTWFENSRLWVAHAKEGGPLGEDATTGSYWVFRVPSDPRGTSLADPDDDLSAGGNIALTDGSVAWKHLQEMDRHPPNSASDAWTAYGALW